MAGQSSYWLRLHGTVATIGFRSSKILNKNMIGEKHGSHSVNYSWLGLLFLYCPAHDIVTAAEEEFIYRMEWGKKNNNVLK